MMALQQQLERRGGGEGRKLGEEEKEISL